MSDRLRELLRAEGEEIAAGMAGLCDAIRALAALRDRLAEALPEEDVIDSRMHRLALGVQRACKHLTEAVADLPDECWAEFLKVDADMARLAGRAA